LKARASGLSDIGKVRETNEDQFLVDEALGLYAVADGMGGHAAGEIASDLAIKAVADAVRNASREGNPVDGEEARRRIDNAVAEANRTICDSIAGHDDRKGMGTTMVVLLALRDRVVIGHVGDSRAYLLRSGRLRLLTSDHSWVNEQVRLGILSQQEAHRHPMRNVVTRALGSRGEVRPELTEEPLEPGDAFLLCSDGLNVMLTDEAIRDMLQRSDGDPARACRALVEAANAKGGEDNTTVIVLSVGV
jgi:protein phosphatase